MHGPTRKQGRRAFQTRSGHGLGGAARAWLTTPFHRMLDRIDAAIEAGSLDATLPDGTRRMLGGRAPGPAAVVDLIRWRALMRLAIGGSAGWYKAWARGEWSSPDPVALFALVGRNRATLARGARARGLPLLAKRLAHRLRRNHRAGARRNIEFHYDLGNGFYAAWLDAGMTYSSATFAEPGQPLEDAQAAKLAAMLARTATAPGDAILEIGCGWGSFVEAAALAGRRVHGITLSAEQKSWADARIARAGLEGATVAITDYRDVEGRYDAVVSIEMAEAVGREYWPDYLGAIARTLRPGGRAAIQYIAFDDALFEDYAANVDFIQTYVFPGGLLISESRFRAIAEGLGLAWEDRVAFGAGYAETLGRWRENFDAAAVSGQLPPRFDAKFVDMWRYYLMYCEGGFRGGGIDVAQVTLVKEG